MIMDMKLQFPSISVLFSLLIVMLIVLKSVINRSKNKNPTLKLPPGPWQLPLIGNMHQIFGSQLIHHTLRDLSKKYGPLMHLQLGEVSAIVVSSPEMAREFLKTHGIIFAQRPFLLASSIVAYGSTNIAFSPYGDYWRQLRKICVMELLSSKRVQSFRSIREKEVLNLVRSINANAGSPINLTQKIFAMTYGITARAAFGKKSKDQEAFMAVVEELLKLATGFSIADVYPSVKILSVISGIRPRLEKVHRRSDQILENIASEHRERERRIRAGEEKAEAHEDLVDVLLKIQKHGDLEFPLTDNNIKAVILDIFTAGSETSSIVVDWAISELLRNPGAMERAQAEVRQAFKKNGNVDENQIPRNTKLIVNAWAISRDPEYWTEADEFMPDRFMDSPIDFRGTDFQYIPFGAGRRICPGISFAMLNIELTLAQLLYHFNWELPGGLKHGELDMTETNDLTARRKHPLCLIPVPYLCSSHVK